MPCQNITGTLAHFLLKSWIPNETFGPGFYSSHCSQHYHLPGFYQQVPLISAYSIHLLFSLRVPKSSTFLQNPKQLGSSQQYLTVWYQLLSQLVFCYCDKHHGQKQLWRERFISGCRLQFIIKRSLGRNQIQELKQRPWKKSAYRLVPRITFSYLSYTSPDFTAQSGLDPLTSIINQENGSHIHPKANLMETIHQVSFSSSQV